MKLPWQDKDKDGEIDDYPFDTWTEIFLAQIAFSLAILVILAIISLVVK